MTEKPLITKLVKRKKRNKLKNILFQTPELIKRFLGNYLFLLDVIFLSIQLVTLVTFVTFTGPSSKQSQLLMKQFWKTLIKL